jgi:hypothetical protein
MDKLAIAFFALFLACIAAMQESAKRTNIQGIRVFVLLAFLCLVFALVFLLIAWFEQSGI